MKTLFNLVLSTVAVLAAAYIIQGVHVDGFLTALVVAIVLGLINTFVKPIVQVLTLPINFLTLGLFSLVITALMIMLADALIPGFTVTGFIPALLFGILLSLVSTILFSLSKDKKGN